MVKESLITILIFFNFISVAQNPFTSIKGKVTDVSGQALQGVSVYINNTTNSTQTEKDGTFILKNVPLQIVELVLSSVNYETYAISVDTRTEIKPINIQLKRNTVTLNEVVVSGISRNNWAMYGTTFTKDFLSYSSFSKDCEILNPKVIKFRNNKKDNILKAYAAEPLIIRNNALGYDITYWLEEYEHRFSEQIALFKGYTQFTEMKGSNRKKTLWKKNRNAAYNGSLTHFLKSVYNGNTADEGFIVNRIKSIHYKDINLYVAASADTTEILAIKNSLTTIFKNRSNAELAAFYDKINYWFKSNSKEPLHLSLALENAGYNEFYFLKNESIQNQVFIYRFNVSNKSQADQIKWQTAGTIIPDNRAIKALESNNNITPEQKNNLKIKIFYTTPLDVNNYVTKKGNTVFFRFDDSWQVTYTKEAPDIEYIIEQALNRKSSNYQSSILAMAGMAPIIILPDGYHTGFYSLITGAYWSYEKTDKLLPLDFQPSKF